jgi:hypothetical protein
VDFAGKTGSAQNMSNDAARKLGLKHTVGDNGWFVGFEPRRNPDVVVCVLFESGEAGSLAARIAAQVVYAYHEKHRAQQTQQKSAELKTTAPQSQPVKPATNPGAAPSAKPAPTPAAGEMTGVWSTGDELKTGRFRVAKIPAVMVPLSAAPGIDAKPKEAGARP